VRRKIPLCSRHGAAKLECQLRADCDPDLDSRSCQSQSTGIDGGSDLAEMRRLNEATKVSIDRNARSLGSRASLPSRGERTGKREKAVDTKEFFYIATVLMVSAVKP
jgi:hypothetical protein